MVTSAESVATHTATYIVSSIIVRWVWHVLRREEEYVGRRVMVMDVPGERRRGRPKRRWLDSIRNDSAVRELSGEEAQDRVQRRRLIRNIGTT